MATAKPKVRVKRPGQSALFNAETGAYETPKIDEYFDQDHPLVRQHPWAFGTDAEIAQLVEVEQSRTSVPIPQVEAATAAPGERRATRRS